MQRYRTARNLTWLGLVAISLLLPAVVLGATRPGTPTADPAATSIYRTFLDAHLQSAPAARPNFDGGRAHPNAALALVGLEVSADTAAGRFHQDEPAVGRFDNGNYLSVWRDPKDGPEKIYGRRFNFSLLPLGPQFDLFGDDMDREPEDVATASDGQRMLVGFVDRVSYHVVAAFTDSIGIVQSSVAADEVPEPQYLAAPAAARLYPRGFVTVWEEFRGGWRIFGQRFDSAGVKVDANVNVDGGADSLLRLTPAVAGDTSGGYLVAWSEGNQTRCDVYARIYTALGTAVGPAFPLTAPVGSESYMLPAVVYVAASDEFWVTYVRTDDPADSTALFYSRLTRAGALVDSAMALPAGPYPWAPVPAQLGSQVAFYTERFDNQGEIRSLELTFGGSVSDSTTVISDAAVRERRGIAATTGFDSVAVLWQDRETGDYDILGRLRAAAVNATPEFKFNQSNTGGQQQHAEVAARQGGGVQVVFTDTQLDDGDISLVDVAADGTILNRRIVNDDGTLAPQYDAHAAGDSAGRMLITWTDERTDWTGPARHAAGRYVQGGSFAGAAFPLSTDQTASSRSQTDVAAHTDGATAVVWVDDRSANVLAYMRRFAAAGTPTTGDLALYDGSQAQIVVALEQGPLVSIDSLGLAWTAWSVLDALTDSFFVYAQAWGTDGTRRGTTQDLSPEGATAEPLEFDIQALSSGDVRLVWYSPEIATAGVWVQDFDTSGTGVAAAQRVSDSGVLARTPAISQDLTGRWAVSWSQQNGLYEDVYWQRFDTDGTPTAGLEKISAPINTTHRRHPALAYSGTYLFGVWHDNEVPGKGYDVRLSSVIQSAAAVGDDISIRPDQLQLHPNYPNPFNPNTVIAYTLDSPAQVQLDIFDVLGRRVRALVSDVQVPGSYRQMWDGRDDAGGSLGSGVYFYRLRAGDVTRTRKMVLLR